jgi:hypothetical protein
MLPIALLFAACLGLPLALAQLKVTQPSSDHWCESPCYRPPVPLHNRYGLIKQAAGLCISSTPGLKMRYPRAILSTRVQIPH